MAEAQDNGVDDTNRNMDDSYWEGAPRDNQGVYTGFINLLKFSIIAAALVLAFLLLTKPAPL